MNSDLNSLELHPAAQSETIARYRQWIENGYAGKMGYLERHLPLKADVRQLLAEAKVCH